MLQFVAADWRNKIGSERWLLVGLVSLIPVIFFTFINTLRLERLIVKQQHSLQVQGGLDNFLEVLSDYEVLRRQEVKRQSHRESKLAPELKRAEGELEKIETLLQSNPDQVANLLKLRDALAIVRASPFEDHLVLLNNLEEVSQSMMDIESAKLESRHPELVRQIHIVNITTYGFGALSFLLLGFSVFAVSREIKHRRIVQERLERSERAARSAAELKSKFVATVSHELRTPLNGIISVGELLRRQPLNSEGQKLVGIIHQSGRTLLRVINDILDFSKIEAGKVQLEEVDFSLPDLIHNVIGALSPRASEKKIDLVTKLDPELPTFVRGDGDRLAQVLFNLVGNGIKFTDHGKVELELRFERQDSESRYWIRFIVQDTGIGMDTEELRMTFQPFVQHERGRSADDPGTGLGLTISHSLVTHMGGDIWVESVIDKGSTFQFVVPFKPALTPTQTADRSPPAKPLRFDRQRPPRILVAEDNTTNQEIARALLEPFGASVEIAANGVEALNLLRESPYDLILMDCQMPEMDGYQATTEIRKIPELGKLPIVAMTANATAKDRAHCAAVGMSDFLIKPILLSDLMNVLERWLGRSMLNSLDPEVGQKLKESIGESAYRRVVASFLASLADLSDGLRAFELGQLTLPELRKVAHRYRSAAKAVGALRLAQLCSDIERNSVPNEDLITCISDLGREIESVRSFQDSQVGS